MWLILWKGVNVREWTEAQQAQIDEGVCPRCGENIIATQENVGFEPPDPVKIEITHSCSGCGEEY